MGDAENALPPTKKRAAGREISRDNPGLDDEEESSEQEAGTFKRASDEVLAGRRIVKVRRNQSSSTPSSNPFAGICLVPPSEPAAAPAVATTEVVTACVKVTEGRESDAHEKTEEGKVETGKHLESKTEEQATEKNDKEEIADHKVTKEVVDNATNSKASDENPAVDDKNHHENAAVVKETKDDKAGGGEEEKNDEAACSEEAKNVKDVEGDKAETKEEKDDGRGNGDPGSETTPLSSFQQLSSSQNAFTGLAGTGFSSSSFTFGPVSKDGSPSGTSTGSLFGQKNDQTSFGFGLPSNGSSSIFGTIGSSMSSKSEGSGFPSMQEVLLETGEENETVAFSADSVLFEFPDGSWKERGKGEVKVNVSTTGSGKARLLMRARGNYRLILNASLYPDMKLTNMDKRGVTFACMNSTGESKDGLSTFALKFKDASVVTEFRAAVEAHKDKTAKGLNTPENSPKASDE